MRGKVFTLASVALLSCRGVLGIEEIDEPKDGGATVDGGAADSDQTDSDTGVVDGGTDAPVSTCALQGSECGKCCRMAGGPAYKEELEPIIKPCLCDGGCASSCGTNLCTGGDPKDTPCLPCMDTAIRTDTCKKEKEDCAKSPTCKAVYDCLASCK